MQMVKKAIISPNLEEVAAVSEKMADAAAETSGDTDIHFRINAGLTEAITNSILHGCKTPDDRISVEYWSGEGVFQFKILDPGQGPGQGSLCSRAVHEENLYCECGRGITIIRWAADVMRCEQTPDGFLMSLTFRPFRDALGSKSL